MANQIIPDEVSALAKEKGYDRISLYGQHQNVKVYSLGVSCECGEFRPTGLPELILYYNGHVEIVGGNDAFDEMDLCDKADKWRDKVAGCMVGGAVGDALGYAVEFDSFSTILRKFGPQGITRYEITTNGKALISDDTQMTLFTANGIMIGDTRGHCRGIGGPHASYCAHTYNDWLTTQTQAFKPTDKYQTSWLLDIPELYARRAPGNTCLSAIRSWRNHEPVENNSCGCGGVMRIAPIPLYLISSYYPRVERYQIARESAAAAEITHKHPLGYIPAALLGLLIADILTDDIRTAEQLRQEIVRLKSDLHRLYPDEPDCRKMEMLIDKALQLSASSRKDQECISEIGEGWTGHQALAIAVFCVLRHPGSFEDAVVAAVNHDGDSDSTGAICGNIMGALLGKKAIPEFFTENLELLDIIEEISGDISDGCPIGEYVPTVDYKQYRWEDLYCNGHRRGDHNFYKSEFEKLQERWKNRED